MNFGLDYDGTITGAPNTFDKVINVLRADGHKVYITTMRYPSECKEIEVLFGNCVDGIIPTSRMSKEKVVERIGIKIDIWIDDNPKAVHMSADEIWGKASPEGQIVIEDHNNGTVTTVNVNDK